MLYVYSKCLLELNAEKLYYSKQYFINCHAGNIIKCKIYFKQSYVCIQDNFIEQ